MECDSWSHVVSRRIFVLCDKKATCLTNRCPASKALKIINLLLFFDRFDSALFEHRVNSLPLPALLRTEIINNYAVFCGDFPGKPLQPQRIARRHEWSLNDSMKRGFLILLLSVSVAASQDVPNKSLTLTWNANRASDKVTGYRVYELVKSRRVLIGQSKTPHFVIPRKKGKHVYVVTAVSARGESAPSTPLPVQN